MASLAWFPKCTDNVHFIRKQAKDKIQKAELPSTSVVDWTSETGTSLIGPQLIPGFVWKSFSPQQKWLEIERQNPQSQTCYFQVRRCLPRPKHRVGDWKFCSKKNVAAIPSLLQKTSRTCFGILPGFMAKSYIWWSSTKPWRLAWIWTFLHCLALMAFYCLGSEQRLCRLTKQKPSVHLMWSHALYPVGWKTSFVDFEASCALYFLWWPFCSIISWNV